MQIKPNGLKLMRIGFDAKRAFLNNTGLGNYSRTIIAGMCNHFPNEDFFAFTSKFKDDAFYNNLKAHPNLLIKDASTKTLKSLWRSWSIAEDIHDLKLDVYHGLSNELPLNAKKINCKKVVTIHDLIFEQKPELYPFIDRKIYRLKFSEACKNADTIIAISEQTKRDIMDIYGTPETKIKIVYQTTDAIFRASYSEEAVAQIKRKYNLPDKFILNVGTIETRKNALTLLKALRFLPKDTNVVIVGKPTAYLDELIAYIDQENLMQRVLILNHVGFHDLPLIYKAAQLFVYPSRYEGFGIPIIEALQNNIPVIAATGSCLEEAGGEGALYFHPDDDQTLGHLISSVLEDKQLYHELVEKGAKHIAQFSPAFISQQLMDIYKS